jgi:hypothetical protein
MFSLLTDFENYTTFKQPDTAKENALNSMLNQLVAWGAALQSVRSK